MLDTLAGRIAGTVLGDCVTPIEPVSQIPAVLGDAIARSTDRSIFHRLRRNVAWLAGGRGFAAIVSIIYLAIVARVLGPTAFGIFSLILAYGSSVAALAQFQSSQAVIRFGAVHIAHQQDDRLRQLLGFLATIDGISAATGAVLSIICVPFVASWFGWTAAEQHDAMIFGGLLLLSTGSTAAGILRLLNRFDLLTYAEMMGPLIRLAGAVIVWMAHGELRGFLGVWAIAALSEGAAGWVAVLVSGQARLAFGYRAAKETIRDNAQIIRFLVHTSFTNSLGIVWQYSGTFAVGAVSGTAAAGAFRIATKLATALAKPADLLTRALFPELARLAASRDRDTLASLTRVVTAIAIAVNIVLLCLVLFAGEKILALLYGHRYLFAYPYLLLLTIAALIELCGIALEPVLNSHGRSGAVMNARIAGAIVHVGALFLFVPAYGARGAGWAAILSAFVIRIIMSVVALHLFRTAPAASDAISS